MCGCARARVFVICLYLYFLCSVCGGLLFCSYFVVLCYFVIILFCVIFIFVCTSVGPLPPDKSQIAVNNNNNNNNNSVMTSILNTSDRDVEMQEPIVELHEVDQGRDGSRSAEFKNFRIEKGRKTFWHN